MGRNCALVAPNLDAGSLGMSSDSPSSGSLHRALRVRHLVRYLSGCRWGRFPWRTWGRDQLPGRGLTLLGLDLVDKLADLDGQPRRALERPASNRELARTGLRSFRRRVAALAT